MAVFIPAAVAAILVAPPSGVAHTRAHKPHGHEHRHRKPHKTYPLKMIWGPFTMPDGTSAFPVYRELGVQVLQTQLSWATTAPQRPANPTNPADPAYVWPQALEQAIAEATRYHIQVAIMVKGAPGWSNGGRDPSWAPENPADYANFVAAASRRYPSVRYWMIWGEPERPGNFNPMPENSPVGPQRYAQAARRRVWRAERRQPGERGDRRHDLHGRPGLPAGLHPLDAPARRTAAAA